MTKEKFADRAQSTAAAGKSVCVGLDSDWSKLPEVIRTSRNPQLEFNTRVVEATADIVAAYKPNSAFYEAQGSGGISALVESVAMIRRVAPHALVILDAKRGDIGNTNFGYVDFAFNIVGADAITLHPYLGSEASVSFLSDPTRGAFVLCRTSNPGAGEFQDLLVGYNARQIPLYEAVARAVAERWNTLGNCGLVLGATYPSELRKIRGIVPSLPVLVPGVGAQGADLMATIDAADVGDGAVFINSSRGIAFASNGPDFADAARSAAIEMDQAIRAQRLSKQ